MTLHTPAKRKTVEEVSDQTQVQAKAVRSEGGKAIMMTEEQVAQLVAEAVAAAMAKAQAIAKAKITPLSSLYNTVLHYVPIFFTDNANRGNRDATQEVKREIGRANGIKVEKAKSCSQVDSVIGDFNKCVSGIFSRNRTLLSKIVGAVNNRNELNSATITFTSLFRIDNYTILEPYTLDWRTCLINVTNCGNRCQYNVLDKEVFILKMNNGINNNTYLEHHTINGRPAQKIGMGEMASSSKNQSI